MPAREMLRLRDRMCCGEVAWPFRSCRHVSERVLTDRWPMSSTHHVLRCRLRRAIPLGLFAAAALGCGSEFASGEEMDGWDGQGGDHGSGGAGASTTTPSGEGGMGGTATTSTGPGGSGGTTSHTGGGGGVTSHTGGSGGSPHAGGAGGSGGGAVSPPACDGTPFSTSPPHPPAGALFTLTLNLSKPGQGWTCLDFAFTCPNGSATEVPGAELNCTALGCTGTWGVAGCTKGLMHARFAQHALNLSNCFCDNDNSNCSGNQDGQVIQGGVVEAECSFKLE